MAWRKDCRFNGGFRAQVVSFFAFSLFTKLNRLKSMNLALQLKWIHLTTTLLKNSLTAWEVSSRSPRGCRNAPRPRWDGKLCEAGKRRGVLF